MPKKFVIDPHNRGMVYELGKKGRLTLIDAGDTEPGERRVRYVR